MITAAASKYTATAPPLMRNAAGNIWGARVAMTLYTQATPVPIAMRVNIFRLRVMSEFQPRTKNGHPPQSTTGVAKIICSQFEVDWLT